MNKPSDYKAIAFWGKELGSFDYYIKDQQREACADGVPVNVIYKSADGWETVERVSNMELRARMEAAGII
tara:strand:- start:144 stop:353 length:210 start_codon:yes stop_codon:yes gene_type:complete